MHMTQARPQPTFFNDVFTTYPRMDTIPRACVQTVVGAANLNL